MMKSTGLRCVLIGLLVLGSAGCGGPGTVEGKVQITSSNPFGKPKANKPKPPQIPPK